MSILGSLWLLLQHTPDSMVHGANMRPIWGQQDQGGPHDGPMTFAIWDMAPKQSKLYILCIS